MSYIVYHLYHWSNYSIFKILEYTEYYACIYYVRVPGFRILIWSFEFIGSCRSLFKLLVFLYLYVGDSHELKPRGPFLHLPPRWILPANCRRPQLSLSGFGTPKGTVEWRKWTAWTYAVSLIYAYICTHILLRNNITCIATLVCFPVAVLRFKSWKRGLRRGLSSYVGVL